MGEDKHTLGPWEGIYPLPHVGKLGANSLPPISKVSICPLFHNCSDAMGTDAIFPLPAPRRKETDMNQTDIGQTIRKFREDGGWTQMELAYHAGLAQQTVCSLERHETNCSLQTLLAVTNALGVVVEIRKP